MFTPDGDGSFLGVSGIAGRGDTVIPESSPLQRFFKEVVERNYDEVGLRSSEVHAYVANLLAEFCETATLYKIRNADDRPL
ncbi:MAG TPA: hypothetical protein VKL99_13750, partial [Candidatus Angelobacter sp.]|nr:hypothetical protein [Candidatus Angelobacter sp.]